MNVATAHNSCSKMKDKLYIQDDHEYITFFSPTGSTLSFICIMIPTVSVYIAIYIYIKYPMEV